MVSFIGIYSAMVSMITGLTLLFLYLLFLFKIKDYQLSRLGTILLIFFVFFIRGFIIHHGNHSVLAESQKNFYILLKEKPQIDGNFLTSNVKDLNTNEKLLISYQITTERELALIKAKLDIGMACKVRGKLEEPSGSRNENQFDYKKYLSQKQIFWVLEIEKLNLEDCLTVKKTPTEMLFELRNKGIEYISEHFPPDTAPLAAALIFGDRDLIDEQMLQSYQQLGIIHLLAISGFNVAMIVGMLYYLGIRLGVTSEKVNICLILFLPIYMILTGATPSVNRACLMTMIILLIQRWNTHNKILTLDIISIVFSIYILISPFIIFDVGFQLSFCVCFALLLSAPFILKNIPNPIFQLFSVSFIAQISATPIMLYNFYEISLISIFANIVFVPLFSIIILPLLLILFCLHMVFGEWITPLFVLSNFVINISNKITEIFSTVPYLTIALGRPSMLQLAVYIIGVPFLFFYWETNRKRYFKLVLITLTMFAFHIIPNKISPYGEVTLIDVGQGDSILLRLPYNKGIYLIDTGGTVQFQSDKWKEKKKKFEVGKDVLVPFLKSKGINTIDKLILTHGDLDHIGGTLALMEIIKIKEILMPRVNEPSTLEKKIKKIAENNNTKVRTVHDGQFWRADRFSFHIVSPDQQAKMERNDGSVVIHAKLGGLNWLFTGDLEEQGEEGLIDRYPDLDVDVLKVGHHGSKSSTSDLLLEKYTPKIGVISVGRKNRFGHPHRDVIEKLESRNIKILRTDKDGSITYKFKGEKGTFFTHIPYDILD